TPPIRPNTRLPFNVVTPCNPDLVPKHTLNANRILHALKDYPDRQFPHTLAGIATYGARLGYEGPSKVQILLKNHKSAFSQPGVLDKGIAEDLILERTRIVDSLPSDYYVS